jgi:hypothetical protein
MQYVYKHPFDIVRRIILFYYIMKTFRTHFSRKYNFSLFKSNAQFNNTCSQKAGLILLCPECIKLR